MTITPDDKDWTWVLERPCPECGYRPDEYDSAAIAEAVREQAHVWRGLLAAPSAAERPRPDLWSALEYGCHVRDVFRLYDYRLHLMLDHDDPDFPNWDQDATAIAERYAEQHPSTVAAELADAARQLADSFESVAGEQWQRTGRRSDGAVFSVDSFARYMIHDPVHHVHDVIANPVSAG